MVSNTRCASRPESGASSEISGTHLMKPERVCGTLSRVGMLRAIFHTFALLNCRRMRYNHYNKKCGCSLNVSSKPTR